MQVNWLKSIAKITLILALAFIRLDPNWEIHRVISVLDGDTIIIENGEHVRYIGIDTPETIHPSKTVECYGKEASIRNNQLVLNKIVLLEKDIENRDGYGRLLRYVYTLQGSINAKLVKEGYAYSYYHPPDLKHYKRYLELEIYANQHKKGLWLYCQN